MIDEVVLRRVVGDRAVMAGQADPPRRALAEREARAGAGHPAENPWHTGLAGPFVLARLPTGREVAYLDNQLRGQVVTDRSTLLAWERRWESVAGEALPARRSIELIREVATTMDLTDARWRTRSPQQQRRDRAEVADNPAGSGAGAGQQGSGRRHVRASPLKVLAHFVAAEKRAAKRWT